MQLIFQTVWHELEQEMGAENLRFPAEIFGSMGHLVQKAHKPPLS